MTKKRIAVILFQTEEFIHESTMLLAKVARSTGEDGAVRNAKNKRC